MRRSIRIAVLELIMLEFNHIYRLWYRQDPPLKLREDLAKYLQDHEKAYFDRIKGFKTQKIKRSR